MQHYRIKVFVATFIFSLFATGVHAQNPSPIAEHGDLKLFEFEFGYGVNIAGRWDGAKAKPGNNLILELRLNRPYPFDFGLQLKMGNFEHRMRDVFRVNSIFIRPSLFFDYNYRLRNIVLFAGAGLGGSFIQNKAVFYTSSHSGLFFDGRANNFAVTPRIGIAAMGWLRITAEYVITNRDYSCFDFNIGLVLGGSYKKSRAQKKRDR